MFYVEKILRFTLPLVIVLCVLQIGVLALFKDDTPILEIPVPEISVPEIPVLKIPVYTKYPYFRRLINSEQWCLS